MRPGLFRGLTTPGIVTWPRGETFAFHPPTPRKGDSPLSKIIGLTLVALLLTTPQSVLAVSYTFTSFEVPGASETIAYGISDSGQIVGAFTLNGRHGFITDGVTFNTIDVPGATQTQAYGINAAGQIVGLADSHAFIKNGNAFTVFDVPGANTTQAQSINNAGQIVGRFSDRQGTHGFLYQNGSFTVFDVPGAIETQPFYINNAGQIIGIEIDAITHVVHGFLKDGNSYTLIDVPGAVSTSTYAGNVAGQIVGLYEDNIGNGVHSFLKEGSIFTTLNVPFTTVGTTEVRSINDSGQIVGDWGDGRVIHGFVASPIVRVTIDIKPGSSENTVNPKSHGKIPVAILSTSDFNAPLRVNIASITFGRTGDEASLASCQANAEDVNGDGLPDLVCHFKTELTGFQSGDTEGILKGKTTEGTPIIARDSVRIVPF
jgi:probable HAF family extracellular repeat protein